MSDSTPADTTADPGSPPTDVSEPDTGDQTPDLTAEVDKWKAQARKHEERAKANAQAAKELEEFKRQSMSETEKAIDEARTSARREALVEAGGKVAAAEIRAAATGRMDEDQLDTLIDNVNLARFVDEDGEVDRQAVAQFVDGIAPKPSDETTAIVPTLDMGQGTRNAGQNAALNGDPLLRSLKDKLGIS